MTSLISLTIDTLTYLKQKWNSEVAELERQMAKEQKRLDARLDRQEDNTEQVSAAEQALNNAQNVLDAMIQAAVDESAIVLQQATVEALTSEYEEELQGDSNLTAEDVQLALMNIDVLGAEKGVKEERVLQVETILNNAG